MFKEIFQINEFVVAKKTPSKFDIENLEDFISAYYKDTAKLVNLGNIKIYLSKEYIDRFMDEVSNKKEFDDLQFTDNETYINVKKF